MVWVSNKKIDEKDIAHKEMTNRVISAFEDNTKAFTSFSTLQHEQIRTQQEQTNVIQSLNDKINDVLTKRK